MWTLGSDFGHDENELFDHGLTFDSTVRDCANLREGRREGGEGRREGGRGGREGGKERGGEGGREGREEE